MYTRGELKSMEASRVWQIPEILLHILTYVEIPSLLTLRLTNIRTHAIISTHLRLIVSENRKVDHEEWRRILSLQLFLIPPSPPFPLRSTTAVSNLSVLRTLMRFSTATTLADAAVAQHLLRRNLHLRKHVHLSPLPFDEWASKRPEIAAAIQVLRFRCVRGILSMWALLDACYFEAGCQVPTSVAPRIANKDHSVLGWKQLKYWLGNAVTPLLSIFDLYQAQALPAEKGIATPALRSGSIQKKRRQLRTLTDLSMPEIYRIDHQLEPFLHDLTHAEGVDLVLAIELVDEVVRARLHDFVEYQERETSPENMWIMRQGIPCIMTLCGGNGNGEIANVYVKDNCITGREWMERMKHELKDGAGMGPFYLDLGLVRTYHGWPFGWCIHVVEGAIWGKKEKWNEVVELRTAAVRAFSENSSILNSVSALFQRSQQ